MDPHSPLAAVFAPLLEYINEAKAMLIGGCASVARYCYEWYSAHPIAVFSFPRLAMRCLVGIFMGWLFYQAALLFGPDYKSLAASAGGWAGGEILHWGMNYAKARAEKGVMKSGPADEAAKTEGK